MLSFDRVMPGGLWDKFERDLRIEKQSDHAPWGGTRSYFWRSDTMGHFAKREYLNLLHQTDGHSLTV